MNMPLALLNRRRRGAVAFSPTALFALAEPGVWYDPSDLTTLFQDTAGTTPVTTPGQSVALALDKSKGLVLGSELVTNGTFDTDITGWSPRAAGTTLSWVSGQLRINTGAGSFSSASQVLSLTVGRTYLVTATIYTENAATPAKVSIINNAATLFIADGVDVTSTTPTNVRLIFTATETNNRVDFYRNTSSNTHAVFADNISVKELPGFHATQATAGSRPIYGIVPVGGRRNLLTFTEDFSNAVYTTITTGGSVTRATSEIAFPATTSSSSVFVARQAFTSIASNYTGSVELRAKAAGDVGKKVGLWLNDGSVTNFTWHTLTADWVRITVTESMSAASSFWSVGVLGDTALGGVIQGAVTVEIRRAQLETGSTATAYQRVVSQYDVTEAGVSSLSYLAFDGVDDFLVIPTITPGIDKAQVFAGVRKLSDAVQGAILEMSTASTNNGSVSLWTGGPVTAGANYHFNSRGTALATAIAPTSYAAPITNVITGLGDIAGDLTTIRINGTQAAQVTTDQGTGNYLAYPFYIGRRAGTTFPFNGNIFSLIVRFGANLTADQINSTEAWVGGKVGFNWANLISPTIFARDETAVLDRFNQTIERRA